MNTAGQTLFPKLRKLIEEKYGSNLYYSFECEPLIEDIYKHTGQRLSLSTLKRIMGFVNNPHLPRRSTLDIIAKYLGFRDFLILSLSIGEDSEISDFENIETVEAEDLEPGDLIKIKYEPNREILFEYLGENMFIIKESQGCKLQKGDKAKISQFVKNMELVVSEVIRNDINMGNYIAAKIGGLTDIQLL